MKSALVLLVLSVWVSAIWSSEVLLPSQVTPSPFSYQPKAPVQTPSSYETSQYQYQDKFTSGGQVSVQSKVIAPQTGPIVTFSTTNQNQQTFHHQAPTVHVNYEQTKTTYQRPVNVHQEHVQFQHVGHGYNQGEKLTKTCLPPSGSLNLNWVRIYHASTYNAG